MIRLSPRVDSLTLLRVFAILYHRQTTVHAMDFDADRPDGPLLTARVSFSGAAWDTVRESLRRAVGVMEVSGRA
ncbi:hypothetical protein [Dactylosporangium sp. CA-092794]|uniref:hypothetical protein n=1 Tax=Dactylosporangium sp. CA-092794 TaxID=3239929 RepID=UPI003D915C7C